MIEKPHHIWLPIMPLFTLLNVGLAYMVSVKSALLDYYSHPVTSYTGLFLVCLSGLLAVKDIAHFRYRHDLFAAGCQMLWFSYWKQFFSLHAPMFFLYPLIFVLLSVILSYNLVWRHDLLDQIELKQYLSGSWIKLFPFPVLMVLALMSLLFPSHFLAFAVVMSLFMIRHSVARCLER